MKIIFLDFDGVLNHELWAKEKAETEVEINPQEDYNRSMIDPSRVALLNHLIEDTGAKVVVSSSWRNGNSKKELQELLDDRGFKGEIIGRTPSLSFTGIKDYNYSVPRGCEIKAWLETNKDVLGEKISKVRYVILDDDSDMLYWQRESFFWVDPFCGLTPSIIHKATLFLNR